MDPQKQMAQMQETIDALQRQVGELSGEFYKNNFGSSQTFNKDCVFYTRLRVPVYSAAPTVAEIGDIIAVSGVLYICTVAGNVATPATFTKCGSQ